MMSPRLLCLVGSIAAHTTVFAVGNAAFVRSAQYAVELGDGGVDATLIAAPIELLMQEEDIVMPAQHEIEEESIAPAEEKEKIEVQTAMDKTGDGSSPVPGEDKTTYHASGGALSEAKADYLRNPAPLYPAEARRNEWEGAVLLRVHVDGSGRAADVRVEAGSGHAVLDEAALRAVRGWRFKPAQVGDLPVQCTVRIPIRFQLEGVRQQD